MRKRAPNSRRKGRANVSRLGAFASRCFYFFLVWAVLAAVTVVGYNKTFDFERICKYQYCPSSWVLAAGVGCLVLGMVWIDFFFSILRPALQLYCGKLTGTRIGLAGDRRSSLIEQLVSPDHGTDELWSPVSNASLARHLLVTFLDFVVIILFVVIPVTAIISLSSGIAYLEQSHSPKPPGLP